MADEQRGPVDEGNGGPVTPGAELPHGGAHGTGTNGHAGGRVETVKEAPAGRGRFGVWVERALSLVVLVLLLIFIVQNDVDVPITFLGAHATLPSGVALLVAAALGILLAAIPAYGRILQLRRALHRKNTKH